MKYIQIDENNRIYEFDPNKDYTKSDMLEEKVFCSFLERYGWERYKYCEYNSGQHHIYVIFNYKREYPVFVGFLHALECDRISKESIQKLHFLKQELFRNKVVFIHTINVAFGYRRKGYASYMVDLVKQRYLSMADLMVEATKKGKKFWPSVGFIKVQRTLKGQFMICPKGSKCI